MSPASGISSVDDSESIVAAEPSSSAGGCRAIDEFRGPPPAERDGFAHERVIVSDDGEEKKVDDGGGSSSAVENRFTAGERQPSRPSPSSARGTTTATKTLPLSHDIDDFNLCYPLLRASPSFGEGMRPHADEGHEISEAYALYVSEYPQHRRMTVHVEWGDFGFHPGMEECDFAFAELTLHGLGRRPAYKLIGSARATFSATAQRPKELSVSWDAAEEGSNYPEYLATLRVIVESDDEQRVVLRRNLHVLPPPGPVLEYDLQEMLWASGLFDADDSTAYERGGASIKFDSKASDRLETSRRRGFGLELETVQLPPDVDAGYFTLKEEFHAAVRRARDLDGKVTSRDESGKGPVASPEEWDRLLLWDVGHDPQVDNAAPPSRADLFDRLRNMKRKASSGDDNDNLPRSIGDEKLEGLLLGGKGELPDDRDLPDVGRVSQASPEFKSPPPPHELYHSFPLPTDGRGGDAPADREIRLVLDGVLKNPAVSERAVLCPTVSDIGQSASSIHVHVNMSNPLAWPRIRPGDADDIARTRSLLGVVLGWIRFDSVARTFSKPWMWRDRSLAPMNASGPEFLWREVAWKQGANALERDSSEAREMNMYNVPAFFRHVFETYHSGMCGADADASTGSGEDEGRRSLFDSVFDHDVVVRTLFRDCSLNLLALRKYGTVEFRRMHATLDADFICAYTGFCVGFVEKFGAPDGYDKFARPFLEDAPDWRTGLERLVDAQNRATIEDLVEIMAGGESPVVTLSTVEMLLGVGKKKRGDWKEDWARVLG